MWEMLIKVLIFLVMPVSAFFVGKSLLKSEAKFLSFKNILCIIALSIINFLLYDVQYQMAITLLNFSAIVIYFKILFKRGLFDSFIMAILLMILMFISEILLSVSVLPFFPANLIRNIGIPMFLSNLFIACFTVLLSKINFFNRLILNIFCKLEKYTKFKVIILSVCWIFITAVVCYFIFNSITYITGFWIGSAIQVCFIIFIVNFFREKNKYIVLNNRFESVYNYLEDMENYINAERLNMHEYKNQLSVIRSMTRNKKILDYIDSIINEVKGNVEWSSELSNLPSGGFKGLIYYKFIQANYKKLNITIDVSETCRSYFEKMSLENLKELSRLLGIYLDNAIEAAEQSNKKIISLEIYKTKIINIVVSNSVDQTVDIKNFNKKGYTSKGKGRGHGLYLAQKIIEKNSNIESETKLVNSYFVQKIKLK